MKKMKIKKGKKGFTIVEIVVAATVFVIALLGVANVLFQVSGANISKRDQYTAINIGTYKLDSLKTLVHKGGSLLPTGTDAITEKVGKYNLAYDISKDPHVSGNAVIYNVTVKVSWEDQVHHTMKEKKISTKIYSF